MKFLSTNFQLDLIRGLEAGCNVPIELKSKEEFEKVLEKATEVRIVHVGDSSKVKLRTKKTLYTFKTSFEEANSLVKGSKAPVVEV